MFLVPVLVICIVAVALSGLLALVANRFVKGFLAHNFRETFLNLEHPK